LIVPNTWLSNTYSESIRRFILTNSTNLRITATPTNTFEGISVDTLFFNAIKNGVANTLFQIGKLEFGASDSEQVGVLPFETYSDGKTPISMVIDASLNSILSKIKSKGKELSGLADITRGIHPYRTGGYGVSAFGTGCQIQKDVDERPYNSIEFREGYRPFIYGKNLKRFENIKSNEYINYGKWLAEPREPTFFEGERVYSRKILGERLIVTFVNDDSVADQQVYITKPKKGMNALYLTGVLGSKLMSFYIRNYFDEVNDAFPQIKVKQLKSLPINTQDTKTHAEISKWVEQVLAKKQATPSASTADLEAAIDRLVYQLYDLSADDIALIEAAVK
jgi:adenine-specific DNA-methyltransferase